MIDKVSKRKYLERIQNKDEKFFVASVLDKASKFERENSFEITGFMDLNELKLAREALGHFNISYIVKGVNDELDKKNILFIPDYMEGVEDSVYSDNVVCIKIIPESKDKLAHRDFMGAIYNLSVEREYLGDIIVKDNMPQHLVMTITKAKFEQIIIPIVEKVMKCGKVALEKAKIKKEDLDGILLVGGSCRIPKIQEELIKNFGDKLIKSANLDLAVAEGAAIQADILAGNTNSDILLLDVCPLGLGIETMNGVMTTLVESNTTIPCTKEQIFTTASDNQTAVTINVLQGERPLAKDNKQIGLFNLDGIAPARRGIPQISVKFDIDANGILSVSAIDKATGKEQHITIENKHTLSQEEIDRIKREAKEHEAEDKKTQERLNKLNEIDSLVYQVEKFVDDYKDKSEILTEDDKTYFNDKMEELKKVREGDLSDADSLIDEVSKRLATVGSKVYADSNGNQAGSNPFGFGQQGFDFANSNFGDMFTGKGSPNTGQASSTTSQTEDVEEV